MAALMPQHPTLAEEEQRWPNTNSAHNLLHIIHFLWTLEFRVLPVHTGPRCRKLFNKGPWTYFLQSNPEWGSHHLKQYLSGSLIFQTWHSLPLSVFVSFYCSHCPKGGAIPTLVCQLLSGPACVPHHCARPCALEPQGPVAMLPGPPAWGARWQGVWRDWTVAPQLGETCDSNLNESALLT